MNKKIQKLQNSNDYHNNFETKYFLQDKKRGKDIAFLGLIIVAVLTLAIFTVFAKNNQMQSTIPQAISTDNPNNYLTPRKIKVANTSTELEKKDINIKIDDEVKITLEKDHSSDKWELKDQFDTKVLKLDGIKFKDEKQNVSSSKPTEEWTFTAIGIGTTEIIVNLMDEKNKIIKEETFKLKIYKI